MTFLLLLAWASLALGLVSALWIAFDLTRRPQPMGVMNAVWPLCALFAGPVLLAFYQRHGRAMPAGAGHHHHHHGGGPFHIAVAKGALHCGAGCTLGDILAEGLSARFPGLLAPFGYPGVFAERIFAAWGLDFVVALAIGIAFQYFAIAPMRGLGPVEGLKEAAKADVLSLASWQVGMYGLMALARFAVLGRPLEPDTAVFWFAMQFAMIAGFVTAYPTNWALIRAGIKEAM
ncbi:DUF4396 domain-containing protein [Solirhodobacter olei]|uniref:DUF4396 domain-containing protein n=1 Tax=Solirhodobacter olei TaxID=2493082 RepID=UPI000FDB9EE3|nr:DUF4396 domain-containing protein [Solirhodobacter olei]